MLLLQGCGNVPARRPAAQVPPTPPAPTVVEPLPAVPPPGPAAAAGPATAALLLPLSGGNATLGQGMLDAAGMAIFDIKDSHLTLLPRDTGGTPDGAVAAARDAIDHGARIIIGPLTAAEVQAVKPIAAEHNVPILAFSTAAALAGNGTYLLGFLPDDEVRRIVSFAHGKGVKRIAFLGPGTAYGHIVADSLKSAAAEQGVEVGQVVFFDPAVPQPIEAVRHLGKVDGGRVTLDGDALMAPMGSQQIKAIGPLLLSNGIEPGKVRFLGTGLWDDPSLVGEPVLEGAWYAAPDPAGRADFERRFQALHGRPPPRLSTLAYDATALAAALSRGPEGADYSPAALGNPNGFLGLDGVFRLRADGRGERGLAVLEIHRTGVLVVSPGAQSFTGF